MCHPVGDGCPLRASKCPQEAGKQLVNLKHARGAENSRMALKGALLALCQALGRFRVRVMLLNLAEGFSIASNVKGGCRATPPEQLACCYFDCWASRQPCPGQSLGSLGARFQGAYAAFVEA